MFRISPAATSAVLTTYVPVSTQVAFGATVAQLVVFGVIRLSLTTTLVSVAAPVFVIVTVYVSVSPSETSLLPSSSALAVIALARPRVGAKIGVLTVFESTGFVISSLVTEAVFTISPAVTSAAVTT